MDEIEHRLERIEGAIGRIERHLSAIGDSVISINDRLGRQVAVTEALRSDVRVFGGIAQAMLTAVQALAGAYTDLSGRVTDLENRAGG